MEIEDIESITPQLFTSILNSHWRSDHPASIEILSLSTERVEQGVLSQVYRVHLEYSNDNSSSSDDATTSISITTISSNTLPSQWLLKLCRTDLNLSWMCRNEAVFYSQIVPHLSVQNQNSISLPSRSSSSSSSSSPPTQLAFSIPPFLSGDDQHLLLQEVLNVETFPLTDGCPVDKIPLLRNCLVSLHATCWRKDDDDDDLSSAIAIVEGVARDSLVFPAGMGQRLHPLQKEGLFVTSWKDTVHHIGLDPDADADTLQFITRFCQKMETVKIRDVHELVHQHRVTLIHGDFHISNFLFPIIKNEKRDADNWASKPYLVDWATAGFANPMIDLVFFLVVSTNDQIVTDTRLQLEEYYRLLIRLEPRLKDTISMDTLQEWFQLALICQWTILVAYDEVCRQIANSEPLLHRREAQMQHFRNVNRRAVLALKSIDDWSTVWEKLEMASEDERKEARVYCDTHALSI